MDCFSFGLCSTDHVGSGFVVGGVVGITRSGSNVGGIGIDGVRITGTGGLEGTIAGGDGQVLFENTRFPLHVGHILLRRLSNSSESEETVIMTCLEIRFKETKKSHRDWNIYLLSVEKQPALLSGIRSQSCIVLPSREFRTKYCYGNDLNEWDDDPGSAICVHD